MKRGFCLKCSFQFIIAELNKFDDDTYVCPNCGEHNNLSEMYLFDPL